MRLAALPTSSLSLSARIPDSTSYRSVQRTGLTAKASKTFDVVLPTRWHAAGSISAAASPVTFSGSLRDVGGMLTPDRTSVNLYRGGTVVGNPSFDDDTFAVSAPPGSYTLRVEATSLYDSDEPEWRPDRDVVGLSVDPFELQTDRHEDLRLPLVPFPVRVLDHAGEPVPGAWVESLGNGGTSGELFSGAQTTGYFRSDRWTDANGETTLRVLPGMAVTVRVDPPGGRGLPAEVELPSTATSAEVPLADAPTLRGRISTADGQPVRPQHGSLRPESGGPERSFTVAEDGTYAVSALLGRYRMALDTEAHFYRPSENAAFWHLSSSPFELSGDTNLDITIPRDGYGGERGQVSAVNAEGWSMGDGFGDNVHGESIGDFELAPGVRATSTFSIFAPEGGWGSRRLPILVPSRLSTRLPWNSAVELPALYVAPGERTVVAQVVGSTLPTPVAPGEIGGRADGEDSATVTWSPSERDFGSPVLGYLVSPDHGRSVYVKTPATTAVLTGLSPGTTYRFSVAAVSRRGIGEARGGDPIVTSDTRPVPQVTTTPVVPPAPLPSPTTTVLDGPPAARSGYWMVGSDGRVYPFGDAKHLGEPVNELGSADVVDLESTHSGDGYWVLDERGRVFAYGDAVKLGDATLAVGEQATSLSATSSGSGYWVFTNTGRVIRFGDTQHYGDMAGVRLNGPVLDSVATPSGKGYYMVASDGGVFTFGDAHFAGSMGGKKLNAPVQSLVPDGDGHGYWLVASDGGVFAFGAPFSGSMAGTRLNRPVTGMVRFGNGYLMVGQDGGVFSFSDRQFHGSLGDKPPANPVVSVAVLP